jgi:hypothetical protein
MEVRAALTTGNVNVPPDATLAGRAAVPHWKMVEVILHFGFVIAVFAVQVTCTVEV